MMKPLLASLLVALGLGSMTAALASPLIELKDGSSIQGDIQGIEHGEYTIVSPSLGTLHVAQSNIARIVYGGGGKSHDRSDAGTSGDGSELASQALRIQARLAQDPEAMKSVLNLQSDPQIQAILNDPAIIQAIQQGDYTSLLNNPKIQALDSNAQLKQLLQQIGH